MKRLYKYYDKVISRIDKKDQEERLKMRFKNFQPINNNKSPYSYNFFRKKLNKSIGSYKISKEKYNILFIKYLSY